MSLKVCSTHTIRIHDFTDSRRGASWVQHIRSFRAVQELHTALLTVSQNPKYLSESMYLLVKHSCIWKAQNSRTFDQLLISGSQGITDKESSALCAVTPQQACPAAVNFGQYDNAAYMPYRPSKIRRIIPTPGSPNESVQTHPLYLISGHPIPPS